MTASPGGLSHDSVVRAFPELSLDPAPLGGGGMKNAYLGSPSEGKIVLKVIYEPIPEDEETGLAVPERLRREIEAMGRVDHPNIVKLLGGPGVKEIDGSNYLWYLEPYYSGGPLAKKLGSPWPVPEVIALVESLVQAVKVLFAAGIVHRDIKPQNIVLDEEGNFVLLDLGIALILDMTPITHGWADSPKTRKYAAPEQFELRRKAQIDFRTDFFLIGMVAFEALTGVHAFVPNEPTGFFDRLLHGKLDEAALASVNPPAAVTKLLRRLLAAAPSSRFRSFDQFERALANCQ